MKLLSVAAILCALGSCTAVGLKKGKDHADTRPNVIILLADDLGYGDLSCYGSQSVNTPHIDALAAEGMRFTRFYAGSAVCTPSRACLLTGKFPLRYDIRGHFSDVDGRFLPEQAVTLPELLKEAGYATAHIGKWHLGGLQPHNFEARRAGKASAPGPLQHGFDHYLANIEGPVRQVLLRERRLYREGGSYMFRNDEQVPPDSTHWTDLKIEEAIRLVETWQAGDQPFFLNLWFDVPHTPYEPAPEPHLSRYEKLGASGDQLYFRSMVSHLDAGIGRLVDRLKELGIYDNTMIIFTSDNGPAFQGSPGPFRGGKTDLHEGGIRVPLIAVWPRRIPANTYSFQTAHMADLLPTISEAAGFENTPDDLDGISILPHLKGGPVMARNSLLWQMDLYRQFQNQGPKPKPYATSAILKGKWKLLADSLQPTELFNLEADHRELYNLLGKYPEIEQELLRELEEFHSARREPAPREAPAAKSDR